MYELHPLCTLFPRLDGSEFAALCSDIKRNGLRHPITLLDGMVLDGGSRYRACIAAGVEPRFVEFEGDNPVAFVLSANLHRRHLQPGQHAAIVALAQDWARVQTHGGDRKTDQGATLPLDRVTDRAALSGASKRTQKMADAVARRDPGLARKVAHGDVSLPKAAEQVGARKPAADKPDTQQARMEELEAENESLRDRVDELAGLVSELDAQVRASEAVLSGEAAKRILALEAEIRAMAITRDDALNLASERLRQIRALERKTGRQQ